MFFDTIARISFGNVASDYNYCSDRYTVSGKESIDDSNWSFDLVKQNSAGPVNLQMKLSAVYGDGIVRLTIDEKPEQSGTSHRFHVPNEPKPKAGV